MPNTQCSVINQKCCSIKNLYRPCKRLDQLCITIVCWVHPPPMHALSLLKSWCVCVPLSGTCPTQTNWQHHILIPVIWTRSTKIKQWLQFATLWSFQPWLKHTSKCIHFLYFLFLWRKGWFTKWLHLSYSDFSKIKIYFEPRKY